MCTEITASAVACPWRPAYGAPRLCAAADIGSEDVPNGLDLALCYNGLLEPFAAARGNPSAAIVCGAHATTHLKASVGRQ